MWVAGEAMLRRWSGSCWDLAVRHPDHLPAAEGKTEVPGWLHQIYAVGDAVYASAGPDLVLKYQGGAWTRVGKIPRSISNGPPLDGAGPDALFAGSDYYSGLVRWDSRGASSFTDVGDGLVRAHVGSPFFGMLSFAPALPSQSARLARFRPARLEA